MKVNQKDFDKAFTRAWEQISQRMVGVEQPSAYVLGGLPGSGKSRLGKIIEQRADKNIVIINGDELRLYHPNLKELQNSYGANWVEHTQQFSGKMVEAAIEKSIEQKMNAIVEGTFRTSSAPINTLKKYKEHGYETNVEILAINKETAWQGTIDRANNAKDTADSRTTPREHFDKVVHSIGQSADEVYDSKFADKFRIHTRDNLTKGNPIYDSRKAKHKPSEVINRIIHNKEAELAPSALKLKKH